MCVLQINDLLLQCVNIFIVGLLQLLNHKFCLQSETFVLLFSFIAIVRKSDGLLAGRKGRFGDLDELSFGLQFFCRYVDSSGVF